MKISRISAHSLPCDRATTFGSGLLKIQAQWVKALNHGNTDIKAADTNTERTEAIHDGTDVANGNVAK